MQIAPTRDAKLPVVVQDAVLTTVAVEVVAAESKKGAEINGRPTADVVLQNRPSSCLEKLEQI